MNARENSFLIPSVKMNVGGIVHVPPAVCPRPAYSSAYIAAHVERTGSLRTHGLPVDRPVSSIRSNSLFLEVS